MEAAAANRPDHSNFACYGPASCVRPSSGASLRSDQLSQVLGVVKDCMRDVMQSLKRELALEREASEERPNFQ